MCSSGQHYSLKETDKTELKILTITGFYPKGQKVVYVKYLLLLYKNIFKVGRSKRYFTFKPINSLQIIL